MEKSIKIEISTEDIIKYIKKMNEKDRKSFLFDLLSALAPEYLGSLQEAEPDCIAGQITPYAKGFGN